MESNKASVFVEDKNQLYCPITIETLTPPKPKLFLSKCFFVSAFTSTFYET